MRAVPGLLLALLVPAGIAADAPRCDPSQPPRTVFYPERNNEAGLAMVQGYAKALGARGVLARHCLVIEHSSADLEGYGLRQAIAALRDRRPAAILAGNGLIARAAVEELPGVPVIFQIRSDPVRYGLAESFARPGGMATGISSYVELVRKNVELLRLVDPDLRKFGVIGDPAFPTAAFDPRELAAQAQRELAAELSFVFPQDWEALEAWLASGIEQQVEAWIVLPGPIEARHTRRLVARLEGQGKPAIYSRDYNVRAGGLMAYEADVRSNSDAWARMLDAVFSGTAPGEIPIERAALYELTINADAAASRGLPARLLKRATAVIRTAP